MLDFIDLDNGYVLWSLFLGGIAVTIIIASYLGFWSTKLGEQLYEFGVQCSRLTNFSLGGSPDETLSYRVAKENGDCWFCTGVCKILDWVHTDHCKTALIPYEKIPHRPIWTWILFWCLVLYFVIFRPFGLT